MDGSGSTAVTRAKRSTSGRVSFPVPAPRSRTSESAPRPSLATARSIAAGEYSGRERSYSAARRPKLDAREVIEAAFPNARRSGSADAGKEKGALLLDH